MLRPSSFSDRLKSYQKQNTIAPIVRDKNLLTVPGVGLGGVFFSCDAITGKGKHCPPFFCWITAIEVSIAALPHTVNTNAHYGAQLKD